MRHAAHLDVKGVQKFGCKARRNSPLRRRRHKLIWMLMNSGGSVWTGYIWLRIENLPLNPNLGYLNSVHTNSIQDQFNTGLTSTSRSSKLSYV